MGLFDSIREKATELMSGATEKAGELVGNVPGVEDLTQSATDTVGQASEDVTGAAQDLGATGTDAAERITDVTDRPL